MDEDAIKGIRGKYAWVPISREEGIIMKKPELIVSCILITIVLLVWLPYCQPAPVVPTPSPTSTHLPTLTPTFTPSLTPTPEPSPTNTPSPTSTVTEAPPVVAQPTATIALTPTQTPVPTETPLPDYIYDCTAIVGGDFYTINRGDSLWTIADSFYCRAWLWPVICQENGLSNCNLIHAGNRLYIPALDFRNTEKAN